MYVLLNRKTSEEYGQFDIKINIGNLQIKAIHIYVWIDLAFYICLIFIWETLCVYDCDVK